MNFMNQWVYSGKLVDPNGEFFIAENPDIHDGEMFWHLKYQIRQEMIPSFIKTELAKIILVAGKTKTYLRKFCNKGDWTLNIEFISVENIISFKYTEGSKYKAFENWCMAVKRQSDQILKQTIVHEFNLHDHLKMIKSYLLLGQGDFMNNLMENLQSELGNKASEMFKYTLLSILDTAK